MKGAMHKIDCMSNKTKHSSSPLPLNRGNRNESSLERLKNLRDSLKRKIGANEKIKNVKKINNGHNKTPISQNDKNISMEFEDENPIILQFESINEKTTKVKRLFFELQKTVGLKTCLNNMLSSKINSFQKESDRVLIKILIISNNFNIFILNFQTIDKK